MADESDDAGPVLEDGRGDRDEFVRLALRQATDSAQSGTAIVERQYERAADNQGAVLKSSAKMLLLLAAMRGLRLGDRERRTLDAIAKWDPGA